MTEPTLRRRSLLLAAAAGPLAHAPLFAQAGKTVKIVVGFPAAQATDNVARMLTEKLRAQTGDTYIVDNRPGTGGSIAMAAVAKAPADGSVMMLTHMSAVATNPHLYKSPGYDSTRDYEAVGLVGDLPFVLAVNPSLPVHSVADLVKYAKAHPDKLTNASSGKGTVSHLAMEELKRRAGFEALHVPYKGSSPGLSDVAAGTVSMALETAAAVRPLLEAGKLRVIAVGSRQRLPGVYANVPTLAELGFKDFNASTWLMVIYPAGTPQAIVRSTFDALTVVLKQPDTQDRLRAIGAIPRMSNSTEEAAAYIKSEVKYWGEVVQRSGVTPE